MSGAVVVFLLLYLGTQIGCTVIGVQKGKGTMMICGWLLFTPLIYIGASRIAKPNSKWARENYLHDPMKSEIAKMRFPKETFLMQQIAAHDERVSASV